MFIVEIQPGCWLEPSGYAAGRTCVQSCARRYKTKAAAKSALTRARKLRPFWMAKIVEVTP